MIQIRDAKPSDAERLLEIYTYYVENTAISFEYDAPTLEEFRGRIEKTLQRYPYIVIERDGRIEGYAYAGPFHERKAYAHCAETSVYLDRNARKDGLGRMLYEALEDRLKQMGIRNLYALVAYPETEDEYLTRNSAEFHEHMGWHMAGKFTRAGYKFDRWYHMTCMEKLIGEDIFEKKLNL